MWQIMRRSNTNWGLNMSLHKDSWDLILRTTHTTHFTSLPSPTSAILRATFSSVHIAIHSKPQKQRGQFLLNFTPSVGFGKVSSEFRRRNSHALDNLVSELWDGRSLLAAKSTCQNQWGDSGYIYIYVHMDYIIYWGILRILIWNAYMVWARSLSDLWQLPHRRPATPSRKHDFTVSQPSLSEKNKKSHHPRVVLGLCCILWTYTHPYMITQKQTHSNTWAILLHLQANTSNQKVINIGIFWISNSWASKTVGHQ